MWRRMFLLTIGVMILITIAGLTTFGPVSAQDGQPLWRVITDKYCTDLGFVGVEVDGNNNNVYGLGCKDQSGVRWGMNMVEVCRHVYGDSYLTPFYTDYNNPDSWKCGATQGPEPTVAPVNIPPQGGSNGQQSGGSSNPPGQEQPQQQQQSEPWALDLTCSSAPTQRLSVGDMARVSTSELKLRADPTVTGYILAKMYTGTVVSVEGYPVCGDGYWWWRVSLDGTYGYSAEGDSSEYYLEPVYGGDNSQPAISQPSEDSTCSSAPPQRLVVGEQARVSTSELNLRSQPSLSASIIEKLYTGATVTVVGGPTCADGYHWWQVKQFITGWMADGDTSEYYLEAVGSGITGLEPDFSDDTESYGSADLSVICFFGQRFGIVWEDGEWHHFVEFDVDPIPADDWIVSGPLFPLLWAFPDDGIARAGFRWLGDAAVIGIQPSAFVLCAR